MKYKNPFIHGTLMMERSVIENIGGYDENFIFLKITNYIKIVTKRAIVFQLSTKFYMS